MLSNELMQLYEKLEELRAQATESSVDENLTAEFTPAYTASTELLFSLKDQALKANKLFQDYYLKSCSIRETSKKEEEKRISLR